MRFDVLPPKPAWARALVLGAVALCTAQPAAAAVKPTTATLIGDFQSELGCTIDNDPTCTQTRLDYDADDDVWQKTLTLPAGTWSYKLAADAVIYGKGGAINGDAIALTLAAETPVRFFFDHKSAWVTDDKNSVIAVAPGSFQSELGCASDWQPGCLRSWLQDPDGDGIYTFSTKALPVGNYESKVTLGGRENDWSTNFGVGGAPGGANLPFEVFASGDEIAFRFDSVTNIPTAKNLNAPVGNISRARAHWLSRDTLAWNPESLPDGATVRLHYDATGAMVLKPTGIEGGQSIPLTREPAGLGDTLKARFPHLASRKALKLAASDLDKVPAILKGQIALSVKDAEGKLLDATSVQAPGVLDDLYTYDGPLGITWSGGVPTLRLWAPTAVSVTLHLFDDSNPATTSTQVPMTLHPVTGVWSAAGDAGWKNKFYLYEVEVYVRAQNAVVKNLVTDPYSLSLSINSKRSQLVDLADAALAPAGWASLQKPALEAPEDIVLYELHARDFSINDATVPAEKRGTFLAFTEAASNGMKHLARLARAGLTHVHLLPVFDIATVDEDRSKHKVPAGDLVSMPPDSDQQQAAVGAVRDEDGFNWGYDPYHYTVPEGSYATQPEGGARIREFREMVKALSGTGLRVVMDVVYNHTNASGQSDKSVLDRIVPGYYHRLNDEGFVETSTCCENTATEHAMMEKLMVDSVVTWAKAYKVDGFRFDLMGHHMKANMEKVRDALRTLTLERDGVDGSKIYVYGEGWNFGEVANGKRGVNATQLTMAGTGIGTFSDRLRDAARGGGPFSGLQEQGFISGLFSAPNGINQGTEEEQRSRLLHYTDLIRVGLAGNLKDYELTSATGALVKGSQVNYNGQPGGYTLDPQEVITYVSAHDNETLFDAIQLKAPAEATMEDRVRMHNLGLSLVALGQGIPFFHAGDELLRSKSLDRNSYNSGDWFNKLDFTYASNNWGVGLPPAWDNQSHWDKMGPLLANPALKPSGTHIVRALDHFEELLRIRKSASLFRLRTAVDIRHKVRFHNSGPNQLPGLIAMSLTDEQAQDGRTHVLVLFNANDEAKSLTLAEYLGRQMVLHPVQAASSDPVVRQAGFNPALGTFSVPGRTAAVFVNAVTSNPGDGGTDGGEDTPPPQPNEGCGCSGLGGGAFSALALLLGGVLLTRRRRTEA